MLGHFNIFQHMFQPILEGLSQSHFGLGQCPCLYSSLRPCQVPKLAPTQNLSRIFLALDPALTFVDDTGLRPLHSVLEALDRGVPSWWNESFWADSAGGPDWVAPLPTTSTMTRTTTSTQDLESLLCSVAELVNVNPLLRPTNLAIIS